MFLIKKTTKEKRKLTFILLTIVSMVESNQIFSLGTLFAFMFLKNVVANCTRLSVSCLPISYEYMRPCRKLIYERTNLTNRKKRSI